MRELEQNREAFAYWLCSRAGIGAVTQVEILKHIQSVEEFMSCDANLLAKWCKQKKKFEKLEQEKNNLQQNMKNTKQIKQQLLENYKRLEKSGIRFFSYIHPDYPDKCRRIPDPPGGLYCYGTLPEPDKLSVAVIGARVCSEYGRYLARQFGRVLAENGVQIISGMARGIDGISQWAALEAGGSSFGILGCGVDICYPKENYLLYEKMKTRGGILSEYVPGTQPKGNLFPPRNRIISAFADAILVIEAREKSGTLITVDMALEQGKEVYAVPGRITDSLSNGCNRLIAQGAGIAVSPESLLQELGGMEKQQSAADPKKDTYCGSDFQSLILEMLELTPISLSEISERLVRIGHGISISELMQELVELTMIGQISAIGTNYFVKNPQKMR
ncbi:MAG: DNA-processing protein DprA [Lachnospiraceae bacterium]|nr:DNA-processing protein DprA [Lachnospiraceae bacterium]